MPTPDLVQVVFTLVQRMEVAAVATPDGIAEARETLAKEVTAALAPLGEDGVVLSGGILLDSGVGDDELDAILGDAMVGDEYEDGDGYSRDGLRRVVDDTDIPERLIAWRDAAVRAALEGAAPSLGAFPTSSSDGPVHASPSVLGSSGATHAECGAESGWVTTYGPHVTCPRCLASPAVKAAIDGVESDGRPAAPSLADYDDGMGDFGASK